MVWKILIVGLALFALYKLLTNEKKKRSEDSVKAQERKIAKGELVKDPICGTYVDVENSITVRDGQKLHHFCSYDCRKKFLENLQESGRDVPQLEEKDDE